MKMRSSRSLRVLALAFALLAVLAVGVWLGGHPSWLPPSLRGALVADTEGQRVESVLSLLAKNYYRPLDQQKLVNQGLESAVASLHDPYSHYFPASEFHQFMQITNPQFGGIGVEVLPNPRGLEVTQVFPGSPAARAGLAHGDLITAVGATSLAGRSEDSASGLIRGPIGSQVKLTVRQGGRTRTYVLTRAQIVAPVAYSKLLRYRGLRIGYVQLTQFADNAGTELRVQVDKMLRRGARALVLDLRGNGGGLLKQAIAVASIFVPHGTIVTTKGRNQPTNVYDATGGAIPTRIPMVVLVDHGTASSAEIVTAALQQHHRATVVGTRTYGKGVFQEIVNLPGGAALDMTVGEFFTPNGTNLGAPGVAQGRTLARGPGIAPDVYAYTQPSSTTDTALIAAERALAKQGG
jgi:carboxyl-terminal processing protease